MKTPSVVVIGAGVGGLAAAAHLARRGCRVTVVEKESHPGGRCSCFTEDGHRFDVGPTLFVMPEVYERAFSELGEKLDDILDLRRIDPSYHLNFDDGSKIALSSDLLAMRQQLDGIEEGSFRQMLRYLDESSRHYHTSMERIVYRDFRSPLEYFNLCNLLLLFKLKVLMNHYRNASRYFRDPRLRAAFTFQDLYMGLSPFDAPATYSLLQYSEMTDGVYFPMGGMYAVVEALKAIADKHGCEFLFDRSVERIDIENGRATGVTFSDGRSVAADVVLASADLPFVYQNLLPDPRAAARMDRLKHSCSTVTFFWGVDTVYKQLHLHNLFLAEDYRGDFEMIMKLYSVAENASCYIHAPVRMDPSMAPNGQDTLIGIVPVGHINAAVEQDWEVIKLRARTALLSRMSRLGIHDFEAHIKFEHCITPPGWRDRFHLINGSTHGLAHTIRQMGYLRPRNRHDRYHNLYFTGASTHPGTGIPTVLISAKLVTDRIFDDLNHNS